MPGVMTTLAPHKRAPNRFSSCLPDQRSAYVHTLQSHAHREGIDSPVTARRPGQKRCVKQQRKGVGVGGAWSGAWRSRRMRKIGDPFRERRSLPAPNQNQRGVFFITLSRPTFKLFRGGLLYAHRPLVPCLAPSCGTKSASESSVIPTYNCYRLAYLGGGLFNVSVYAE